MEKIKVFENMRIGKWTVLKKTTPLGHNSRWECLCDCGTIAPVCTQSLSCGRSKSCGCIQITKHGDIEEKRREIRKLLKKGYTSRDILANVYTSFRMITEERNRLKNEK